MHLEHDGLARQPEQVGQPRAVHACADTGPERVSSRFTGNLLVRGASPQLGIAPKSFSEGDSLEETFLRMTGQGKREA